MKHQLTDYYHDYQTCLGNAPNPQGDLIHDILLDAVIDIPEEKIEKRRASMFADGTKAGYSFKMETDQTAQARGADIPGRSFRILVEPGGVGLTLPEQINHSLRCMNRLFSALQWTGPAGQINAIVRQVFPQNPAALNDWWGGIWLGASLSPGANQLKLYLNLRSGDFTGRWQRLADIFAPYADASLEPVFLSLLQKSGQSRGIPVGLALVLAQNALRGFRVYIGLDAPTPDSVGNALPESMQRHAPRLQAVLRSLGAEFGDFEDQSVTIGYDFIFKHGWLDPRLYRFKADVSCRTFQETDRPRLDQWTGRQFAPDQKGFETFQELLRKHFNGADPDYLSFGFRPDRAEQTTLYAKPHGLARGNGN